MSPRNSLKRLFGSQTRNVRRPTHVLAFEKLDAKMLMAGNVASTFVQGTLELVGDTSNNSVYVSGNGGNVVVRGLGTKINGRDFRSFSGVNKVFFSDSGGNDVFIAVNLELSGDLLMFPDSEATGNADLQPAGNDVLTLTSVKVGGSIDIRTEPQELMGVSPATSAGADVVTMYDIVAGNGFNVTTGGFGGTRGNKNDVININKLRVNRNNPAQETQINTGGGSDNVFLSDLAIQGNLTVRTDFRFPSSSGNDVVTLLNSRISGKVSVTSDGDAGGGTGIDTVAILGSSSNSLNLSTSGGNDTVIVDNSSFGSSLNGASPFANTIDLGAVSGRDRDYLSVNRTSFWGGLNLSTGEDVDTVDIKSSRFEGPVNKGVHTKFDLGAGNDLLLISNSIFDDLANVQVSGGSGSDVFHFWLNKNTLGSKVKIAKPLDVEFAFIS